MRLFQVDAFTKEKFRGNPAGVLLSDKPLTNDYMQNIASEMNLSETAFTWLEGNDRIIRYFTPTIEVDLCGHATLATAHILNELGLINNEQKVFFAKKDIVSYSVRGDKISFVFPKMDSATTNLLSTDYCDIQTEETLVASNRWVVIFANSQEEVKNVEVNAQRLIDENRALIVSSKSDEVDFVLRVFAPHAGIPEDPVTGFAQTIIAPIWAEKLNKKELVSAQISQRLGEIYSIVTEKSVEISGSAITVFEMKII